MVSLSAQKFEVIAGNRRYSACSLKQDIRDTRNHYRGFRERAFEIAVDENIHRKNLDPIEEARAFKIYADKYGYGSVTELCK